MSPTSTSHRCTALLATLAAAIAVLAGCSQALPGRPVGPPAGCNADGYSAAAAVATVRCYLGAIGAEDTVAACAALSPRARLRVVESARGESLDSIDGLDSLDGISTPTLPAATCAQLAPLMRRALDALPADELARLRTALAGVRIGAARLANGRAAVPVTATFEGRTVTDDAVLVRAGGAWKIDSGNAFTIDG